jgi:single-strand DNA-binding protein
MASLNKVQIIGNLGQDPTIRYMADGKAVCSISVATTSKRKDRNSGETIEDTQWHRITFYERLAEIAGEYLKKGRPVYVEGRLKYGKYTDQAGAEKNTCDIIATELQLLGGREDGAAPAQRQAPRPRPAQDQAQRPAQAQGNRPANGFDDMDDDIPW